MNLEGRVHERGIDQPRAFRRLGAAGVALAIVALGVSAGAGVTSPEVLAGELGLMELSAGIALAGTLFES